MTIDIATAEGQEAVCRMVADADVVIENYKVSGLARYGLDHKALLAVNPRPVTCSITGFGQTGPYAHRAGYGFIIQGMGGAMSLTGEANGAPQKAGVTYADIFTGVYAAVAILAALRQRNEHGIGAHILMALLNTQVAVLANQGLNWMMSGAIPTRMGNAHPNLVPSQTFVCADGDLIIAVGNDAQFRRLNETLSLDRHLDYRFVTNVDRVSNRDALVPLLTSAALRWHKHDLSTALEKAGLPAGPINNIAEVFCDPQVVARGLRIGLNGIPGLANPILINGV